MPTDCGDQLDRREAGVGHDNDERVWQPALELENALAGPVVKIAARGIYRDQVRSSHGHFSTPVACAGYRSWPQFRCPRHVGAGPCHS